MKRKWKDREKKIKWPNRITVELTPLVQIKRIYTHSMIWGNAKKAWKKAPYTNSVLTTIINSRTDSTTWNACIKTKSQINSSAENQKWQNAFLHARCCCCQTVKIMWAETNKWTNFIECVTTHQLSRFCCAKLFTWHISSEWFLRWQKSRQYEKQATTTNNNRQPQKNNRKKLRSTTSVRWKKLSY